MFDIKDKILMSVQKPVRYTGGEIGMIKKDPKSVSIRFAFCFPDVYDIGMSHLGMKILYHLINERSDTYCERCFAPWPDMEEKMIENNFSLYALESGDKLLDFDILGFTLQYEMSYSNILNMLSLSNIPLTTKERGEDFPFICAGGPCTYNPEPLYDIFDFFIIGEGEEIINEVLDEYKRWKNSGKSKKEFLEAISSIEGIYVPSFYDIHYNDDGTIKEIKPNNTVAKPKVRKRIIRDFNKSYFPEDLIVPFGEIVHDRITLEVFRGCIRGCRFCQAGFIYRPVREKSCDELLRIADTLIDKTGYEEISLCSLSTSDYTGLKDLTEGLLDNTKPKMVNLSLPSLRIDNFSLELMQKVQTVRKSGLTFAPEAGSQRLRDIINKGVTEQDLINSAALVFSGGWGNIKLYFMIGLPYEQYSDIEGIADLAFKVRNTFYETPAQNRSKSVKINVSASSFVPKAFTPFQWEAQNSIDEIIDKQKHLRLFIKSKQVNFSWHEPYASYLEGVFARGDRRICAVLIAAHKSGCKFDGWSEYFSFDKWMKAFNECGVDADFYNLRKRDYLEVLPWDHIDIGVSKKFLISESERAKAAATTPNCRVKCASCGAAGFKGGVCVEG